MATKDRRRSIPGPGYEGVLPRAIAGASHGCQAAALRRRCQRSFQGSQGGAVNQGGWRDHRLGGLAGSPAAGGRDAVASDAVQAFSGAADGSSTILVSGILELLPTLQAAGPLRPTSRLFCIVPRARWAISRARYGCGSAIRLRLDAKSFYSSANGEERC